MDINSNTKINPSKNPIVLEIYNKKMEKYVEYMDFIERTSMQSRQMLKKTYRLNGAVYIADIKQYYRDQFFYQKGSYAYIMERQTSIDIDSEFDFKLAEVFLKR